MKFCNVCDNMLYIEVRDNGNMLWNCVYCVAPDPSANEKVTNASVLVSSVDYKNEKAKYQHLMTPYIHKDPTIPHVSNIPCPNPECTKKPEDDDDVIYVKYDYDNLKYMYSCTHCKFFWV
jgi:DNA-directed RNA polymerase subunit M/transcription elongation factor TFIIS